MQILYVCIICIFIIFYIALNPRYSIYDDSECYVSSADSSDTSAYGISISFCLLLPFFQGPCSYLTCEVVNWSHRDCVQLRLNNGSRLYHCWIISLTCFKKSLKLHLFIQLGSIWLGAGVQRSEDNLQESVFSSHHVWPKHRTQVAQLSF